MTEEQSAQSGPANLNEKDLPLQLEGGGTTAAQVKGTFRGWMYDLNGWRRLRVSLNQYGEGEVSGLAVYSTRIGYMRPDTVAVYVDPQGRFHENYYPSLKSARASYLITDEGNLLVTYAYGSYYKTELPGYPTWEGFLFDNLVFDSGDNLISATGTHYFAPSNTVAEYKKDVALSRCADSSDQPTISFSGSFSGQLGGD